MDSDNKLENVKRSLQFLLDFLGPQDSVSVITFSETARTILTQTAVSAAEKDNIRARISIIRVESNTNLSAGIVQARDSLQIDTSNTKQGILLLTDGIANMGLTRPADILELVRNTINKFNGTSISSVGYGTDHNVELLQSISTEGGGSYYVVNNLEDVATVFGDILGGLVSCAAQQVRVVLPTGTEIKSRYAIHTAGDQIDIVIGDLPSGAEAAFLAKIPVGRPVTLKGYDLVTHNTFEVNTTVGTTTDVTLQVSGEAHYLRFEVLAIIENDDEYLL
jgi:Ca-activated chloride channel family protein